MNNIIIKDKNNNDINIGRILFGGSGHPFLAGKCKDEFLRYCIDSGLFTFDTARMYGNGKSEEMIGDFLRRDSISRDKVTIITKCCHPSFGIVPRLTKKQAFKDIESSLKALKLSYVDCLLLHRDNPLISPEKIISFMNEIVDKGYTRSIGVSNWTSQRIQKANEYALSHNLVPFSVNEPQFSLGVRICDPWHNGTISLTGKKNENERKYFIKNKMPVLCFSSLGNGMFSGKYKADDPQLKKSLYSDARAAYYDNNNLNVLKKAEKLAEQKNCTVAQIAIAYCLRQEFIAACVTTVSSKERVKENLGAINIELSKEEMDYLQN